MTAVDERILTGLTADGLKLAISDRWQYGGEICCRPGHRTEIGVDELVRAVDVAPVRVREAAAERKATALLESLLDEDQLASYRSTGTFWVPTPRGRVRLGRHYDLSFVSNFGVESSLCVVPDTAEHLPDGDVWATLALWLNSDPDRFFRVAHEGGPWLDPASETQRHAHVAQPAPMSDLLDHLLARIEASVLGAPGGVGLRSGVPVLDECLSRVAPGALVLVVGPPSAGRTSLALNMACRTAQLYGRAHESGDPACEHVVFSSARTDAVTLAGRIAFHEAFVPAREVPITDGEWRRFSAAVRRLSDEPWIIHTSGPDSCPALAPPPDAVLRGLIVVDDATAFGTDLAATAARARDLAFESDAVVVLTVAARSADDLPPAVADVADVVVQIDEPTRNPVAAVCGVARKTLRVAKNRHGPRRACTAVHVQAWGRFVPVEH